MNPELKITFLNVPSVYLDSAYFKGFYFITCLDDWLVLYLKNMKFLFIRANC